MSRVSGDMPRKSNDFHQVWDRRGRRPPFYAESKSGRQCLFAGCRAMILSVIRSYS